jgi:hypothetical protein
VSALICIQLWGEEKSNQIDVEEEFYTNINTDLAYKPYKWYKTGCYTCVETEVLDAKFWMLKYWFWPHIYQNRFQDKLLDLEVQIEDKAVNLHHAEAIINSGTRKRRIFGWSMFGIGIISGTIGGFKLASIVYK